MKKLFLIIMLLVMLTCLCSCNRQVFDTTYHFDSAVISFPDGVVIRGKVQSWRDYEGEQLQIKIDGVTYLVHCEDVVLIAE